MTKTRRQHILEDRVKSLQRLVEDHQNHWDPSLEWVDNLREAICMLDHAETELADYNYAQSQVVKGA